MVILVSGAFMYSIDIFCNVIDNYGDAGVCLHLARSMALSEKQSLSAPAVKISEINAASNAPCNRSASKVRLFCNNMAVLNTLLCPQDHNNPNMQLVSWETPVISYQPADVVINAFNCHLDPTVITSLRQHPQTLIINLDYLSAEKWVEDCHGLTSPADGLNVYYFFPGFTSRTGGLNVDRSFTSRCLIRHQDLAAAVEAAATAAADTAEQSTTRRTISLFGYHNPAIKQVLAAALASPEHTLFRVFTGMALDNLNSILGTDFQVGKTYQLSKEMLPAAATAAATEAAAADAGIGSKAGTGTVSFQIEPMVSHEEYDDFLLHCSFNLVRGEDSIVRAMHTGNPFLWQIYPQEENAHIVKLQSFLDRMQTVLQERLDQGLWHCECFAERMQLITDTMIAYNDQAKFPARFLQGLSYYEKETAPLYLEFARYLCAQPNLSENLRSFIAARHKA